MRESRFPPLISGASIVAAAIALVVAVSLLIAASFTPYALIAVGHEGPGLTVTLYLVVLLAAVLTYRLVAPHTWSFTRRFVGRAERPTLPPELVGACLREMDFKCPACSYNWRGLDKPVCPECSTPVQLFLYTDRPPDAKWNGLVFAWLGITLLASGVTIYSNVSWVIQISSYQGSFDPFASFGTFYWISVGLGALTAVVTFLVCSVLVVASLFRKSPEKRGLFVRRTVVWLATLNAISAFAGLFQMVVSMLMRQLW